MIFWNQEFVQDSRGLDIIGIRAIDQGLEAELVNGVTTISARGRYFSILPWAINQFYQTLLEKEAEFDREELVAFLHRTQFLIIAASHLDPKGKPGGAILGSQIYSQEIEKIRARETVRFPNSHDSRMLGTYYNPCRAIGLLRDSPPNSPLPFQLTERGKKIWDARNKLLQGSSVLATLLDGDELSYEVAHDAIAHFSIQSLEPTSAEAQCLVDAFQNPWSAPGANEKIVRQRYERFSGTLSWIEDRIAEGHGDANQILGRNFQAVCAEKRRDAFSKKWAEYEWRRRQHFAQETLLASACEIMRLVGDLCIEDIVTTAKKMKNGSCDLESSWPDALGVWDLTAADAVSSVPDDFLLGNDLAFTVFDQLKPAHQMLGAFGLIAALEKQTCKFREVGVENDQLSASDLPFSLVCKASTEPFEELIYQLLEKCALLPHLHSTLRKMAQNQKCSLRVFPDGNKLRLTATQSHAGFSGSRLDNILAILVDLGLFQRLADGALVKGEAA